MPYPNYHSARIKSPGQFTDFGYKKDQGGKGIDFLFGIKDGKSEIQSIRFDKDVFSAEKARKWLDAHDFDYIKFEEALEEHIISDFQKYVLREKALDVITILKEKQIDEDEVIYCYDEALKIVKNEWLMTEDDRYFDVYIKTLMKNLLQLEEGSIIKTSDIAKYKIPIGYTFKEIEKWMKKNKKKKDKEKKK